MKKLAMLLALVLTCNIFAASSLVSAADGDLFFDFNEVTNATSSSTLPTGWAHTGDGSTNVAETVDESRGSSIGCWQQGGYLYTFEGGITSDTTIEFDLYLDDVTDVNGIAWVSGAQNDRGNKHFFQIGKNAGELVFSNNSTYAVASDTWYKIRIDLFYNADGGNEPIWAKYYVSDDSGVTYLGHDTREAVSAFSIRSFGSSTKKYIDNVSFSAYQSSETVSLPDGAKFYDFNTLNPTANNAAEPTDWVYSSGSEYENRIGIVDAEHEISLGYASQSGWQYNFGSSLSKDTTIEFDLYINDTQDTNKVYYSGKQGDFGGDNCFFWTGGTAGKITFSDGSTCDVIEKTWYKMRIDIFYTEGASRPYLAKYYVNGNFMGQSTRVDIDCLSIRVRGKMTYDWIDNVAFYDYIGDPTPGDLPSQDPEEDTETTKNYFTDFNNGTGTSINDSEPRINYAVLPEGLTNNNANDTWSMAYLFADNEHNSSIALRGNARFYYTFKENVAEDVRVSFEMRTTGDTVKNDGEAFYVQTGLGGYYDHKTMLLRQTGSEIMINQGDMVSAFASDTWYKFDIFFDYNENTQSYTAQVYMNGDNLRGFEIEALDYLYFAAYNRDGAYNMIDNLVVQYATEADTPTTFDVSAKTVVPDAVDGNYINLQFSETIDPSTWDEDNVTVTKKVGDAEAVEAAVDYAALNDTRTGAIVYLNEDLSYGTEYTVTLPASIASVHSKNLTSTTVTTKSTDAEYYDIPTPRYWGNSIQVGEGSISAQGSAGAYGKISAVSGIARISFDATASKIDGVDGTALPYLSLNADLSGSGWGKWPVSGNGTLVRFDMDGVKKHYDVLVDLDTGVASYIVNDTTTTAPYRLTALTQYSFDSHAHANLDIENLVITYLDSVAEFTTNISEFVAPTTTSIEISFADAPNPATLQQLILNKIEDDGTLTPVEFTPEGDGIESAILADLVLVDGAEYVLDLSGVTTTLGLPYENSKIYFKVASFKVTDAAIMDGSNEITNSWDNSKAYVVSVDAINATNEAKTVQVVVAGYSEDALVGVQVIPVTISATGKVTGNMTAMDLTGAVKVKAFVLNDLSSLAPILQTPAEYVIVQ